MKAQPEAENCGVSAAFLQVNGEDVIESVEGNPANARSLDGGLDADRPLPPIPSVDRVTGPDAVEEALAKGLEGATAAGRWDVVASLAAELEARRLARAGSVVVSFDPNKRRSR